MTTKLNLLRYNVLTKIQKYAAFVLVVGEPNLMTTTQNLIPAYKLEDAWLDWEWSEGDPKLLQALAEFRAKRSQEKTPLQYIPPENIPPEDTWAAGFEEYHQ